jgi:hypothetical protein
MSSLLHLASGVAAAEVVRASLRQLERDEDVWSAANDCWSAGPLVDVDEWAACRTDWWARVRGRPLEEEEAAEFDDRDVWTRAVNDPRTIVLWHGPHPIDRIFALRTCWRLRAQPLRVQEVALVGRVRKFIPKFYDAVAIAGADTLVAAWPSRAPVLDVPERADEWERQRAKAGDWQFELPDEQLVRLPIEAYDAELVAACHETWTNSLRVIGTVLAAHPTNDLVLAWRLRELLDRGVLRGRGSRNRVGLPQQLLESRANSNG